MPATKLSGKNAVRKFGRNFVWVVSILVTLFVLGACAIPIPVPVMAPAGDSATMADEEAEEETEMAETEEAEEAEDAQEAEDAESMMGDAMAGQYLVSAARGCGCHFNSDLGTLAGGNKFEGPFGVVYSSNLTPDEATGIGGWTVEDLGNTLRLGHNMAGENMVVMPKYAFLADEDVANLHAYLFSLDPVANEVPAREVTIDVPDFTPAQAPPAVAPTDPVARGQYLASLARCGQCHTPTVDGRPDMSMLLAGAPFRDIVAPNLTPDLDTGLGGWAEQEIADFLGTGVYADGMESHPGMKGVVDSGIGDLTEEDRLAIAAFLKSLPPVVNLPVPAQ